MKENAENRASLCSVEPSLRIRGNEHKLEHQKIKVNLRKHLFTVKVTKHFPQRSISLLKSHPDVVPSTQF